MKTSIFCSHKEAVQFVRNSGYKTRTIRRLLYDIGYTRNQLEDVSKSILDLRLCWKHEEDEKLILSIIKQRSELLNDGDGPASYSFYYNVMSDLRRVFKKDRYPHIKDVIIREISNYLKDTINVPYDIY